MKKILFATTALVMAAGAASAEVAFSGYGRFGLMYTDMPAAGASKTSITSRFRLQIDATTESDAGVTFGARARIQQTNGGAGTGINGVRFYAKAGGLEVGVGNIIGAFEGMAGQYPIDLGLTGLSYSYTAYGVGGADAYSSAGAGASTTNGVEVIYTVGDFKAHISASDTNSRVAGAFAYTFNGYTAAIGYQDSTAMTDTEWTATFGGKIAQFGFNLGYGQAYNGAERWTLAGSYDISDALNMEAYYANDNSAGNAQDDAYGIDFNYDLGGGASFRGGVEKRFTGATVADLGVRFNF